MPPRWEGSYNPYTTLVFGDWLSQGVPCHTGEVFLNGKSLYEQPDGENIIFDVDYYGNKRGETPVAGPFA